jgi:hypothetical protein
MEPDGRQRLESLPRWSWEALSDQWEKGFSYLKEFAEREGHCRVPSRHKTEDNYRLGHWLGNQRKAGDTMEPARRQRLEALRGWVWNVEKPLPQAAAAKVEKSLLQPAVAQEKRE